MLNTSNDQRKPLPNFEHLFTTTAQAPGGVARLRELILTLAVQGKLVPQDPSDEPASELLKKIRAEKDRLIAEGKIKKDKPLPAITEDEKPFELPEGWEWVRIGQVLSLEYGSSLPEKDRLPGFIPVYGSNGIVGFHTSALVNEPSLIVGRKGSVGAINISMVPFWPIDTSYFVTPPNGIELQFAFHLLKSLGLAKHDKATAIPGINRNDVYAEVVGIPPLAEQSRIVARVEALMRLCDALEEKGRLEHTQHQQLLQAMLDSLTQTTDAQELARHWQRLAQHFDLLIDRPEAVDALEQTILQLAVRGLLVPQAPSDEPASELLKKIRAEKDRLIAEGKIKKDKPLPVIGEDEKPFELPVGWEWARFGTLPFSSIIGLDRGRDQQGESRAYPYFKMNNIANNGGVTYSALVRVDANYEELQKFKLKIGDFLFNTRNSRELVGKTCVIEFLPEENTIFNNNILVSRFHGEIEANFIDAWFRSPLGQTMLDQIKSATTNVCAIYQGNLFEFLCPIPPLAEQSRIVARVTELRALCQQLRDKLAQARTTQTQLAQAWVEQVAG